MAEWNARAYASPRWIPVEERLPKKGEMAVVLCEAVDGDVEFLNFSIHMGPNLCDWGSKAVPMTVTHWMPLPDLSDNKE
jgi:hypothetical protein